MDSRTSSILINLDLNLNTGLIANQYGSAIEGIRQSEKGNSKKVYKNLNKGIDYGCAMWYGLDKLNTGGERKDEKGIRQNEALRLLPAQSTHCGVGSDG